MRDRLSPAQKSIVGLFIIGLSAKRMHKNLEAQSKSTLGSTGKAWVGWWRQRLRGWTGTTTDRAGAYVCSPESFSGASAASFKLTDQKEKKREKVRGSNEVYIDRIEEFKVSRRSYSRSSGNPSLDPLSLQDIVLNHTIPSVSDVFSYFWDFRRP